MSDIALLSETKGDVECPTTTTTSPTLLNITKIVNLDHYKGDTLEDRVDNLIQSHGVVIFSKSFCPFCLDVKDFLSQTIGVKGIYTIEINELDKQGTAIHKHIKATTGHATFPAVFIQGKFVGGCDTVKGLHAQDKLMELMDDLVLRSRVQGAQQLDTATFVTTERGQAMNAPFWFPNVVNNYVVRLVGVLVFALCMESIIFRDEAWGQWLAAGLLVDFTIRCFVGSGLSPLGMLATVVAAPFVPEYKPGPPKQFAASVGVMFTLAATW